MLCSSSNRDGVHSVISALQRYNGCILADSVGLGKTYHGVGGHQILRASQRERLLVLCPRKLRENWSLYPAYELGFIGQPVPGGPFRLHTAVAH